MKPEEVAELFGVGVRTVGRWAEDGLIAYIKLPSGHRRYYRKDVEWLLSHGYKAQSTGESGG